jgi:phage gpG-like protein
MTQTFTLLGFVAQLHAVDRDLEELCGAHGHNSAIVEKACQIIQKKAKSAIGKTHDAWSPLAESTKEDRVRHGFPANQPLLRTGELRDSIEYTVRGNEGAVGSNLDIAVYQELGTSRIPPRSFLVSAAIASEDRIHRLAGASAAAVIAGGGRHAAEVRELFHLLREAGHMLKETVEDLLDDHTTDEEGPKR